MKKILMKIYNLRAGLGGIFYPLHSICLIVVIIKKFFSVVASIAVIQMIVI